jgi:uncharacterized protein with von Willebrand factor type A (vWA) domain
MPASEPAAAPRTRVSSRSRLSALTMSSASCSVGTVMILPLRPIEDFYYLSCAALIKDERSRPSAW